jgi:dipeptidyl aminopeptidase/acylaminoacyl peptidase
MAKKKILSPDAALSLRQAGDPQLSPDGARIVFTVTELDSESKKRFQHLWLVPADGGEPRQLTSRATRDVEPRWSPDGRTIAFVSNRAGPSQAPEKKSPSQLWLLPADGGEATRLTEMESSVHGIDWSPDGGKLLFLAPETPGEEEKKLRERGGINVVDRFVKMRQIWVVDIHTRRCRQLTRDRSSKAQARWSPDGERIVFEQRRTPTCNHDYQAALWVMDGDGRNRRKLTRGKTCDTRPRWSPDGKKIAFLRRAPFYGCVDALAVVSTAGGEGELLTEKLDRSVVDLSWSPDGKKILFVLHDGVRHHLHAVELKSGRIRSLTDGDRVISELSVAARRMAFTSSSPTTPAEVHVAGQTGRDECVLTDLNPHMRKVRIGRTRTVSWESADGMHLEGLLILPSISRQGRKLPLVVEPHGGPASCQSCGFNPKWQVYTGNGYAVFAPNFRGSAGYGQAFTDANADDFGGGDFADITAGVDMLIDQGIADSRRLAVAGASYGGYMTAWTIGHTDRFRAAVVGCGVTNLHSFSAPPISSGLRVGTRKALRGRSRRATWNSRP